MMFHLLFTSGLLFIILLCASIGSADGLCLPCRSTYSDVWRPGMPRRAVWNPKITSPTATTQWTVGSQVIVTWDLHNMPKQITNDRSMIVLGYSTPGKTNEHLDLKNPLASGFNVRQGQVTFTVPNVKPRNDYFIVLFGDSGNRSSAFPIKI
ncbi:hypothetical protein Hypma_004794 [Hypsizygus marmoreus]|uniref:Uncharacterized protein n=1 Tax=Hypsizygus marmoreus TaxID=39966 RepID=A0A369J6E8_HYPMA|nr:hypothetical protein Hypma_004794 [Hypsizygus marmoreus]